MATLVCGLAGFDRQGEQVVRSLATLFRPKLLASWSVDPQPSAPDLLLCDIDTPAGGQAWQDARARGIACAAATAAPGQPGPGLPPAPWSASPCAATGRTA